jgi:hypothetical protein
LASGSPGWATGSSRTTANRCRSRPLRGEGSAPRIRQRTEVPRLWQPRGVLLRQPSVRWFFVAAVVAPCLLGACTGSDRPAVPSPTASSEGPTPDSRPQVALRLSAGHDPNIVVRTPRRFHLIVRNLTDDRLEGLRLGMSGTVGGSPGSAREHWKPRFTRPCGAAAGTAYCPLPALGPRGTFRATLTVIVPRLVGDRRATGLNFVQTIFVSTHASSAPVAGYHRVRLHVVDRSTSPPH